jgi:hypothetical protein
MLKFLRLCYDFMNILCSTVWNCSLHLILFHADFDCQLTSGKLASCCEHSTFSCHWEKKVILVQNAWYCMLGILTHVLQLKDYMHRGFSFYYNQHSFFHFSIYWVGHVLAARASWWFDALYIFVQQLEDYLYIIFLNY